MKLKKLKGKIFYQEHTQFLARLFFKKFEIYEGTIEINVVKILVEQKFAYIQMLLLIQWEHVWNEEVEFKQ